jgi:molecular chaperone DnaJ
VKNGSRVRVAKEGGRGAGGAESGDLFLQIEISYDPSLRIEGLDVYGEVALSITDAVLGGELDVPTLGGPVKMTIPPGTQTGKVFRLKDRGVQSGMAKGDHFVTVVVVTPENLTARERELYQELARLRPEKPSLKKPR